jgi:hypothetical protein
VTIFTEYDHFVRVDYRTYKIHPTKPLIWQIGKHWPPQKGGVHRWQLHIWPSDRFDVTIPTYAEWLVALDIIDPHDPDLIAAAAVHDKLLNLGYDKRFAAAEFRRALVARRWKNPVMRELAYLGVYFHTTRKAGHPV